jgi:hypothetical protein
MAIKSSTNYRSLNGRRLRDGVNDIGAFVAGLSQQQRQVFAILRRLIRRAAPEAEETVLWGSLSYHRPDFGGRIKGAVCLITPRTDCVHLGFIHGAALSDPLGVLQGTAKVKRFVPIERVEDIDQDTLIALIRESANYDPRKTA